MCFPGKIKYDIIVSQCDNCDISPQNYLKYTQKNNCDAYECDSSSIELKSPFNKYCLQTLSLFSYILVEYRVFFLLFIIIIYTIFIFFEVYRASKKNKAKIEEVEFDETELRKEMIFMSLQGKNTHDNCWFLDLDIPKEFNSFLSTRDYFTLSRVRILIKVNLGN